MTVKTEGRSADTCLLSALALVLVSTDSRTGVTHSRAPTEPCHPSKSQGGARSEVTPKGFPTALSFSGRGRPGTQG